MTKTELKASARNIFLVGKVKLRDDSFKLDQVSKSGYTYSQASFGVETAEGNVVYVEVMGGFGANPLPIKSKSKTNTDIDINWADRNNPKIIEQVADYKLFKASLSENDVQVFLSQYDFINYMSENIKDGMEICVRGQLKFSIYKGEPQRKFEITGVSLPYQKKNDAGELLPVEYRATFTQTILVDENSLNITAEDEEAGETIIQAYAVDYIGKYENEQIKKNALFPFPLTVKIDGKGALIAQKLFGVEQDTVKEITVEGNIIEGYDKSESVELEISDEIQELIDMGVYTMEMLKSKVQIRGNKVSKLLFQRPSVTKTDDGRILIREDLEKYQVSDLFFFEQAINGEEQVDDVVNDSVSEETITSDEDWLKSLGV